MWRFLFQSLFFDRLALACVRDVPFRKVVPRLLPVMGGPWCIEQSNMSSFLNLWVCCGLLLSVYVFIWLRLFFDPFDLRCPRDVLFWKRLFRGSSQEWVNPGAPEQAMINFVLNLVACLWQVSSVTVFIWMRLIFHSFDFAWLRDVPFWKRLFRGSSQEWANPGGSSSQWLVLFWIFWVGLDLFHLKRSFFEWTYFSSHSILQA